jgi:uncharacterized phage protein (TIGR01671 family)
MQREIKFRAWLANEKRWSFHDFKFDEDVGRYAFILSQGMPHSLMQFTGLKDAKGKEIYEGDILAHQQGNYAPVIIEVYWSEKAGALMLRDKHQRWSEWLNDSPLDESCEVIGNIYENPDLLTI